MPFDLLRKKKPRPGEYAGELGRVMAEQFGPMGNDGVRLPQSPTQQTLSAPVVSAPAPTPTAPSTAPTAAPQPTPTPETEPAPDPNRRPERVTETFDYGSIGANRDTYRQNLEETQARLSTVRNDTYKKEYETRGLGKLKTDVSDLDQRIAEAKRQRDDSINAIRTNPNLSAAQMTGQIKKIADFQNTVIGNLTEERNALATDYNNGLKEVDSAVSRAVAPLQEEYKYLSDLIGMTDDELKGYRSALGQELKADTDAERWEKEFALKVQEAQRRAASAAASAGGGEVGYQALGLSPEQNARLDGLGLAPDQKELVGAIFRGESPPIPPNNPRTRDIQRVLGGLAALGYDNTKAVQDWTSMQQRLRSMNSAQQLRLSQAVFAMQGSVEQAERLYADWQATGLPTGFSTFNRAALAASERLPGQAGIAARTLRSHIEDMAAELAVIYRGGNSPTDQAFEAARKSLNEDWNPQQFAKNLELVRQNLRIRQNSIANSAQLPGNIYAPAPVGMQDIFGGDIGDRVRQAGYDYDAMRADGLSDDEIRSALDI